MFKKICVLSFETIVFPTALDVCTYLKYLAQTRVHDNENGAFFQIGCVKQTDRKLLISSRGSVV